MDSFVKRLLNERDRLAELDIEPDRLQEAFRDDQTGPLVAAICVDAGVLPGQTARDLDPVTLVKDADTDAATMRWLAVGSTLEIATVDEYVDVRLNSPEDAAATIDALLRAGTDWYHPRLVDYLSDDDCRFGAAALLCRTAPDELEDALGDIESTDDIVEILRAVSIFGETDWFGDLREWRDLLVEDELADRDRSRLDGALATLDPERYAQALLMGEIEDSWLSDDRAVADFLTVHGNVDWISTLAICREVRDTRAFELAAAFGAAAAMAHRFDDVDNKDRLQPTTASEWLTDDPTIVAFQLSISDDDELAELLVEATLHQSLIRRGVRPPAMSGLPLSGHPPQAEELDERVDILRQLSMDTPGERVQVIRTLTDLGRLIDDGDLTEDDAAFVLEEFSELGDGPELAASLAGDDKVIGNFGDWGCRGLAALIAEFRHPDHDALCAVADGWFCAPSARIPVYRASFGALLDVLNESE